MSFIEQIYEALGEEFLSYSPTFRALLVGDRACYIEKAKSIVKYSGEEVVIALNKGQIVVVGQELYLKKYCEGDLIICGKITSI